MKFKTAVGLPVFLLYACLQLPTAQSLIPAEIFTTSCTPFRKVLTQSVVKIATSYFADNPRANSSAIEPTLVTPLTPSKLFKVYYGVDATAEQFKQAILDIYYSDPDPFTLNRRNLNRIYYRENVDSYVRAGNYRLARETIGNLIYQGIGDHAKLSRLWQRYRCVTKAYHAIAESVVFAEMERVRNQVGDYRFGRLLRLGVGTTLAFVIDNTGSMAEEIDAAKTRAKLILNQRQGSLDQPQDFVLVPFNDPLVGPLTVTNDPEVFTKAINSLEAYGGGDEPELALEGILLAIENCRPGSRVFVITDVDAKDVELQDLVVAQAKKKTIKVSFLLTNTIVNNICKEQPKPGSPKLLKRRCLTPSYKHGLELFKHIADSTGGSMLVVKEGDILRATEVVDSTVKQGIVEIFRKRITGGTRNFPLRVDSSIAELFVEFKGDCRDITIAHENTIFMIKDVVTVGDLLEGKISVQNHFGTWYVNVTGGKDCDVNFKARTTMGFLQTLGRKVRKNVFVVVTERFEGQPLHSDNIEVLLDAYGNKPLDRVDTVKFLSKVSGNLLDSFKINSKLSEHFKVTPTFRPQEAFVVLVEGIDSRGFPFARIMDAEIEYVRMQIECVKVDEIIFRQGDTVNISVQISNHGSKQETLELSVADSQQFVQGEITPRQVTLAGLSGSSLALVTLTTESNVVAGTSTAITITAKSQSSDKLFYKTCHLVVGQRARPKVKEFYVKTDIKSRLAETSMTSIVENDADVGREAEFFSVLPTNAFITGFMMTIDNHTFHGTIEEKTKAKEIFRVAKEKQFTAGHVTARGQSSSVFRTSVTLEPRKTVKFELTYQELLTRKDGKYTYDIAVRMLQPVAKFSILVSICETSAIENLRVLGFDTEQTSLTGPQPIPEAIKHTTENTSLIFYAPTLAQQEVISPYGLQGKFIVEYDVARTTGIGDFILYGNHYLHFLVPTGSVMTKRVVFALDVSSSMFGHKMSQMRTAMWNILDKLSPTDEFAIATFNGSVKLWTPLGTDQSLVSATAENIQSAKSFLDSVEPQGGTDLLQVLYQSLKLLQKAAKDENRTILPATDFVVVITDGRPTEGITKMESIQRHIYRFNNNTFAIHTIGLGTLVDMPSLQKLAFQNKGTSAQVFLDIDAHIQIENFVDSISHPIIDNVRVDYPTSRITGTDNNRFPTFYDGQELVITGQLVSEETLADEGRSQNIPIPVTITGIKGGSAQQNVVESRAANPRAFGNCPFSSIKLQNVTKRLYAFMQVKSLLREIAAAENQTKKEILLRTTLDVSLASGFVVPNITSMIVAKPNDLREIEEIISAEEANRPQNPAVTKPKAGPSAGKDTRVFLTEGLPIIDFSLLPKPAFDVKMEVIGDPHVVVELNENTRLCFNWMGRVDKVYNLLSNNESGVTVNAKLITGGRSLIFQRPCFIGEIGIVFAKSQIRLKIDPYLVLLQLSSGDQWNLTTSIPTNLKLFGISIVIERLSNFTSLITIGIQGNLEFKIKAHFGTSTRRKHLDFSMTKQKGFSNATTGLLGPFSNNNAARNAEVIAQPGSKVGTLEFRNQKTNVTAFGVFDTYAKRRLKCWLLTDFLDVVKEKQEDYEIPEIFATQR